MAKRKIGFGEGGFKGFLGRHIEKILFGIMACVAAMLVWSGFNNREGIPASKTPNSLTQEATKATSHMNSFSWDTHYKEKRSPKDASDLSARAAQTLQKMSEEFYSTRTMIAPPVSTPRLKRTDPELLAVVELTATAGHGALVKRTFGVQRNQDDQAADDFFQQEEDPMEDLELDPKKFRRIPQGMNSLGNI